MGSVIKGHGYRLIDNRSFEMPLPIKYELLKEDDLIALYEISADEKVSFDILTKYKENMLTPINRPLDISDMYFFFSSRVFQNGTPFTAYELQLLGLDRYNVFDILRKTRGITPYDTYWLRFDGDKCDYETARAAWEELTTRAVPAERPEQPAPERDPFMPEDALPFVATSTRTLDSNEISHVDDILSQHKIDFDEHLSAEGAADEEIKSASVTNNTMSAEEIEALLLKSGIGGYDAAPEPAPVEEPKSSGGKMSQEDIEKMLAAAAAPEPAPAEEPKSSGGKMSQEDIEKMLAAAAAPEPAPAEEPKSTGGKMSQEDIEKMLAAAAAPEPEPAPAPAEEPKSSGGKMSQEDIEKMLAAAAAPEPEPAPSPVEEPKSTGGKMSQEDIEKMLAAAAAPEPEPEPAPAPAEEPKSSGGKMSQEDIEKMLAAAAAPEPEPAPAPAEEPKSTGGKMSQEDIEKMLVAAAAPEPEPAPSPAEEPKSSGGKMSQEDIEKMLANASKAEVASVDQPPLDEPVTPEPEEARTPSGGKMSQADIEALLNGMKEDAGQ